MKEERTLVDVNEIVRDAIRILEDSATQASIKEYRKNFKWGVRNRQKLRRKYGGKLVLILNGQVRFADEDFGKVSKRLMSFFEPSLRSQIASIYIPRENEMMLPG